MILRVEAKALASWKDNINELIISNNELFEGPISYENMEACYNSILDMYDPNVLIRNNELSKDDYDEFEAELGGDPFWSLLELDTEGRVVDVLLYETVDCKAVGEYLQGKYSWRKKIS